MLHELRVENLLLIERAELRLAPGLNVITGETGAGKTVLAHALDLLLGGKARTGIVRPGAAEASVEGVFDLPAAVREQLGELLAPDADELVLARRVAASGRTRALINGRSATAGDLRDAGVALLSFYGQHEHRRLMLASAQLDLLDSSCGPQQAQLRTRAAAAHEAARNARAARDELRADAGARERELDLLRFELSEIDEAAPDAAEHAALLARRERLRHLEGLRGAAFGSAQALAPDDGPGVASMLAAGGALLDAIDGVDGELDALAERWRALAIEATELVGDLRRYGDCLDGDPGALDAVEERLTLLDRLIRKHGGTIDAVLAHAEVCRARIAAQDDAAGRAAALDHALAAALADQAQVADALHRSRAAAAPKLAAAVVEGLADLAMEGASFDVRLEPQEPGPTGADGVEFLLAPNSGVPAAPVRDAASGGELSRVMLALLAIAGEGGRAGSVSTLVFDEIDAGIGGQTARAVGARLQRLAGERQVLCITHLPQVASLAERHFSIEKNPGADPVRTTVTQLGEQQVVGELVRMLGGDADDVGARRLARELRKAA